MARPLRIESDVAAPLPIGLATPVRVHDPIPTWTPRRALTAPIVSRWPCHDEAEIDAVVATLRSGRVNALHHGEHNRAFEAAFAARCDVPHAIAVANGTLALELALRALEVGPGDEVIVPARSFIASASCVAAVGATIVFADVDETTQGLNAATVSAVLSPRTRAIIAVHIAGWPCAVDELAVLADALGIALIEDCAQAHGARLNGRPVGSFGAAAAFSFCTDKIMSTGGEGGLLVLRDDAIWGRAWAYKDHGKNPAGPPKGGTPGTFKWLHENLGSNLRMTEMQAAIGRHQLAKLDEWVDARRRNAASIDRALAPLPAVRLTIPPPQTQHAYYKYYAFVRPHMLAYRWSRDRIVAELIAAGVPAGTGICPEIYLEQAFVGTPFVPSHRLPTCRMLGETSIMLPVDPTLDEATVADMGEVVADVIAAASRG
ncbi:DegT/DnrJ/EryC1/StrS aminotransferase family protein [Sphingomonas sp. SUN019]|uniref:DegT/DnrJ/EryC1/StrS family aminotransferase n=1 Tax=Sphingomonas sp. SUN019 TaxID=2937788 RepID=UPI002164C443|nr:DegT/DnrJ/EryC1/StrS aminotransferase family protein [Sphingomonas sp. SUN019]UVO51685.1 DegT/DnrJ/EryC1/StrS aminotransferase family protein [Sphingomonas sp. SUN019]